MQTSRRGVDPQVRRRRGGENLLQRTFVNKMSPLSAPLSLYFAAIREVVPDRMMRLLPRTCDLMLRNMDRCDGRCHRHAGGPAHCPSAGPIARARRPRRTARPLGKTRLRMSCATASDHQPFGCASPCCRTGPALVVVQVRHLLSRMSGRRLTVVSPIPGVRHPPLFFPLPARVNSTRGRPLTIELCGQFLNEPA